MSAKVKSRLLGSAAPAKPRNPQQSEQTSEQGAEQPSHGPPPNLPPWLTKVAPACELRMHQERRLLRRRVLSREHRPERFIAWAELFERGLVSSRAQARRLWERGEFPRPVHLSERVIAWRESEIDAWIASRVA